MRGTGIPFPGRDAGTQRLRSEGWAELCWNGLGHLAPQAGRSVGRQRAIFTQGRKDAKNATKKMAELSGRSLWDKDLRCTGSWGQERGGSAGAGRE